MDKKQIPDALKSWSESLSRRALLQSVACVGGAATILAVTANRAEAKMQKSAVGYTDSSPKSGQNCSNCAPFQPPNGCRIVEGKVSPQGWCKVWQRKPA